MDPGSLGSGAFLDVVLMLLERELRGAGLCWLCSLPQHVGRAWQRGGAQEIFGEWMNECREFPKISGA